MATETRSFEKFFSDPEFWSKLKESAKVAGRQLLEPALRLYYAAQDEATPVWAKTVIYGALGYFISPLDALPDFVPLAGYTDDLGVLLAAIGTVAAHVKPAHIERAKFKLRSWFG